MTQDALRKIERHLAELAAAADADHPIDPYIVGIIARQVGAQAEMLEQGAGPAMIVHFHVPGTPQGKGRARFGNGRTYTPAKTVAYEGLISMAAEQAMAGRELIDGPVHLVATAIFPIPPSWSAKRRAQAIWHTGKPDGDNTLKAIGDALNGVVFRDDSQVCCAKIMKQYGDKPGLDILVEALAQ